MLQRELSLVKLILSPENLHEQFEALNNCRRQFSEEVRSDSILDLPALEFPTQIATGKINWTPLQSGVSLEIATFQPCQNFALRAKHSPSSPFPLRLLFFLSGHSRSIVQSSMIPLELDLPPGHNLLTFAADSTVTIEYLRNHSIQTVGIGIEPGIINGFFADAATVLPLSLYQVTQGNLEQPYSHLGITTPTMQMVLHQILHCPLQDSIRQVYLESKAIELLVLKLAQIQELQQLPNSKRELKSDDIERIYVAREILLRDIEHPPSLMMLAKLSGLNDYKLKRGFRQVFGSTVFGYLRTYRMEQARQLLLERKMTVSEVARSVGYSSLSRFSLAFKQQFGVSPGSFLGRGMK